jgi:hypothetical protein
MGTQINVGDEYTLYKEAVPHLQDGSYFEALDDESGFIMTTYLTDMSEEEKFLLRNGVINARMIREENFILFILRFGHSPLMFEVSFDPTLYKDRRAMQITFDNHMVHFVGVEKRTNTVQTLRTANFPMKLKQACITAWHNAYNDLDYSRKYMEWYDGLLSFSTPELWEKGEDVGFFGEKGVFENDD